MQWHLCDILLRALMDDIRRTGKKNTMGRDGNNRGPLRAVILAKTGEDVRQCTSCWHCEQEIEAGMDLSFGDIIRAAAKNDPAALNNKTLWNCDIVIQQNPICPSGLDRNLVIHALREEAQIRGYRQSNSKLDDKGSDQ